MQEYKTSNLIEGAAILALSGISPDSIEPFLQHKKGVLGRLVYNDRSKIPFPGMIYVTWTSPDGETEFKVPLLEGDHGEMSFQEALKTIKPKVWAVCDNVKVTKGESDNEK